MRVFFKDINILLKGQFFISKSIAKATLKSNPSIGISKNEVVGDLIGMFDFIEEKGVAVNDRMQGRSKEINHSAGYTIDTFVLHTGGKSIKTNMTYKL
ncbi:MAG: hypothetical protein EOO93_28935 [Pedobacter sp.]|nr:MAG: hypothetical protein EOO93_28935 [Pedobacter sp.]